MHTGDLAIMSSVICQACAQVDLIYSMLQHSQEMVTILQIQLGLESPWKVSDEEYTQYKTEVGLLRYHHALDELKHLVVMQLFELSKLLMSVLEIDIVMSSSLFMLITYCMS